MRDYLIDTSVILHDVKNLVTISQGNTNRIFIPLIVLHECDINRKYNYNARKFFRAVDTGTFKHIKTLKKLNQKILKTNLKISEVDVEIHVVSPVIETSYAKMLNSDYASIVNDTKIIDTCLNLKDVYKDITLITNDIAMRVTAETVSCKVEPLNKYRRDDIEEQDFIKEIRVSNTDYNKMVLSGDYSRITKDLKNFTNIELVITEDDNPIRSILAFYKNKKLELIKESSLRSGPITPANKEQLFFMNMLLDPDVDIVVAAGTSGSGKNLLTIASALNPQNKNEGGIYYTRNTVPAGDDESQLGFLKGDENTKLSVFTYPLIDALQTYIEEDRNKSKKEKQKKHNESPLLIKTVEDLIKEHNIKVVNINQMRGANLEGFVILDEWQNSTPSVNKLMLTRIKGKSKVVILGDYNQVDHKNLNKNDNALSIMLRMALTDDRVAGIKLKKVKRGLIAEFAEEML